MIDLNLVKNIYLYGGVTDFRKGINGLIDKISNDFDINEITNSLFLFCNKSKTSIKIIEVEKSGIWLYQKRFKSGKFIYPNSNNKAQITTDELRIIISGLDFIKMIDTTNIRYDV